jgi:hypothetical protein
MRRRGSWTTLLVDGRGAAAKSWLEEPFSIIPSMGSSFGSRHGTSLMWWTNLRADMYVLVEEGCSFLTVRHQFTKSLQQDLESGQENDVS